MAQGAEKTRKMAFLSELRQRFSRKPGEADDSDVFAPEAYDPGRHGPAAHDKGADDPAPPDHGPTFSPAYNAGGRSDFGAPTPFDALFDGVSFDDGGSGAGGASGLAGRLRASGDNLIFVNGALRDAARRLQDTITAREGAQRTLVSLCVRLFIGLFWACLAWWLYATGLKTLAADRETFMAFGASMPVGDAMTLSRLFGSLAVAGIGASFALYAFILAMGGGDNKLIKRDGAGLGHILSDLSKAFDNALGRQRAAMDQHGNPAEAVSDLSDAHMTALQASAFFREVGFLFDDAAHNPRGRLREFLRSHARDKNPPAGIMFSFGAFLGLVAGLGLSYIIVTRAAPPAILELVADVSSRTHSWVLGAVLLPAGLYLVIGIAIDFLGQHSSPFAEDALDDALSAVRSAVTGSEAPRPAEVIRRIEDALEVFKARVGNRGGGISKAAASSHAAGLGERAEHADTPSWRKPAEGARFVETGFSAAPQPFRADPYVPEKPASETGSSRSLKTFFSREPGAKRRP